MGLNLWKVLSFLRDLLSYIPLPGTNKPRIEYRPIVVADPGHKGNDAKGHAVNVLVFGTTHFQAWQKDDTLRSLIPDPANSVVAIFSGADADAFRSIVGIDRTV